MFRIPIKMPTPGMPTVDIPYLIKLAKQVLEVAKDVFGIAKKVGETKQINVEKAEVNDIALVNNIFNEFIVAIEPKINDIEKSALDEMYYYFDELKEFLNENEESLSSKGIRINRFNRKFEKIKQNLKGSLRKEVSKRFSLDNVECKEIIKMVPGDKKTKRMDDFFNTVVNDGLVMIIEDLKEKLSDIMDDIEFQVESGIDNIQRNIENQQEILNTLESEQNGDLIGKERIVVNALLVTEFMNIGCSVVEDM